MMLSMSHPRPANLLDQRFSPQASQSRELSCALALIREGVYIADLSTESWDAFCQKFSAPQAPAAS
jgi:hypothetical protein